MGTTHASLHELLHRLGRDRGLPHGHWERAADDEHGHRPLLELGLRRKGCQRLHHLRGRGRGEAVVGCGNGATDAARRSRTGPRVQRLGERCAAAGTVAPGLHLARRGVAAIAAAAMRRNGGKIVAGKIRRWRARLSVRVGQPCALPPAQCGDRHDRTAAAAASSFRAVRRPFARESRSNSLRSLTAALLPPAVPTTRAPARVTPMVQSDAALPNVTPKGLFGESNSSFRGNPHSDPRICSDDSYTLGRAASPVLCSLARSRLGAGPARLRDQPSL